MKTIGLILLGCFLLNTASASCLRKYEYFVKNFRMSQADATELRRDIEEAAKDSKVKVKLNNTTVMRWQKSLFFRAKELIREVEGKTQARVEVNRLSKGLKTSEGWVMKNVGWANKKNIFCPRGEDPADYNQIAMYLAAKFKK